MLVVAFEDFILVHVIRLNPVVILLDITGVVAKRISDLLQHACVRGLHTNLYGLKDLCVQ